VAKIIHDKKYIIGFSKIPAMHRKRMNQIFEVYPDVKIVFII